MANLPTDKISWRGIVIGGLVLLAGTATATAVDDPVLPALVAAIVLLILLVIDDWTSEE